MAEYIYNDPRIIYLGLKSEGVIGEEDAHLLKILFLAAKKAITRKWLKMDPPGLSHWLDIIEEI